MKLSVSSSALQKQLTGLSGLLSTNNALPILDCFLFQINKEELKILASDLETTMSVSMKIVSDDSGNIAIPARILLDTLKTFPEQPLTFNIDLKTNAVEISSDNGKYKLTGHPGDDFPQVAELETPSDFEIEASALSKAINKTLFAVGTDELRPVMCGVYFSLDKDGITFVSTDAHKLVRYKRSEAKSKQAISYIIPKKPLSLLKSILTEGPVISQYNTTNVSFTFGNIVIVSKLIDGKYPNYDAVIPKNNTNKLKISRELLQSSIRRVSVFSNKTTQLVRFDLKNKTKMNVSAEDLDFSSEAQEDIKCEYEGEPMSIGFSGRFLLEMLGNFECEEVELNFGTPNLAGLMTGGQEDILMLIMPIMLNNK